MTVLVAYAGRTASAEAIAWIVAQHLRDAGLSVDVRACDRAPDAWRYEAVVLGSALHGHRWDRSAVDYLRAQAPDLAERPTWLFGSSTADDVAHSDGLRLPRAVGHLVEEIGLGAPTTFGHHWTGRPGRWADRIARTLRTSARGERSTAWRPTLVGAARS